MPPVFAHGALRLYLLFLLAQRSMHGYELMQAIEDRFGGTYSPSAGTIYPRLAKLEEEGLVTRDEDGRRSVYEITDAGRAELALREHELEGIESGLDDSVRRLADEVRSSVDAAMRAMRAELAAAAREARKTAAPAPQQTTARPEQVEARRRLHEADLALTGFRSALRTTLQRHVAATGELDVEVLDVLTAGLARVRSEVQALI